MQPAPSVLEKLSALLADMSVPQDRADVWNPRNRAWLSRNLKHKNARHRDYEEVLDLLELAG